MCDARCQRKVDHTEDPGKDFVCRKPHSVRDLPKNLVNSHVPLLFKLPPTFLGLLEGIRLATEVGNKTEFLYPCFCPKRQKPPCQQNMTCNISPVTTELFILYPSMCNIQIIVCANGIIKYILKYVGKFNQGNCVIASVNAHTGATQIGS